ncbi:MAG: smc 5 [Glaciihabitans sp.]|nr:smc 5 [Glaciihabitans sp.]
MRLKRISIDGFRGFSTPVDIDLDADVIVVVAENGRGKTSLFDAVLWALVGRVARIGASDSDLISMYSTTGSMSVRLVLGGTGASPASFTVIRTFDGVATTLQVFENDSEAIRSMGAEAALVEVLWPNASSAADPVSALERAITSSVYLQQDLLKQFIEDDDDQRRYAIVAELLGGGRVAEIQVSLERAKQAYSTAATKFDTGLTPLRSRVRELRAELEQLENISPDASAAARTAWQNVLKLARTAEIDIPGISEDPSRIALDGVIRQVQIQIQATRQRLESTGDLLERIRRQAAVPPSVPDGSRVDSLQLEIADGDARLGRLREDARTLLAERKAAESRAQRLRELADLALEFIDGDCPVCGQAHNHEQTRQRMVDVLGASEEPTTSSGLAIVQREIDELESRLAVAKLDRTAATEELQSAREEQSARVRRENEIAELAAALGLVSSMPLTLISVEEAAADLSTRQALMFELLTSAEQFGIHASLTEQLAGRAVVESELESSVASLAKDEAELKIRRDAIELTGELVPQLRAAGDRFVEGQLLELAPIFQRIYASIDAHPVLKKVELVPGRSGKAGLLSTRLSDADSVRSTERPLSILSSSQANAYAIALFLSMNLGLAGPPLEAALLDDPLQSLDNVHLLGVVDILRRVASKRQLIVSTHDAAFGGLLSRKLRPVEGSGTTSALVITFGAWDEEGTTVSTVRVEPELVPLRLVG